MLGCAAVVVVVVHEMQTMSTRILEVQRTSTQSMWELVRFPEVNVVADCPLFCSCAIKHVPFFDDFNVIFINGETVLDKNDDEYPKVKYMVQTIKPLNTIVTLQRL